MEQAYIVLSPELNALIKRYNFDLQGEIKDSLTADAIRAEVQLRGNPLAPEPDRDVVLILLASAALIAAAGSVATRVIQALAQKDHATIKTTHHNVALDGAGKAIRDAHGNPVYNVDEEPGPAPKADPSKMHVSFAKLIQFDLDTGEAAKKGPKT